VSVIVVSDYSSGAARTWTDERACLSALADQRGDIAFDVLLLEDEKYRDSYPADILSIIPGTRVIFSQAGSSYALKNAGVREATAPIVVVLDADCRPDSGWLSLAVAALRSNPDVAAVSGRTLYEGGELLTRVLGLLTRSYLDPGKPGPGRFIANNAAAFRHNVLIDHPLPEDLGPFSSRVQSESMRRAGHKLWFEPRMRVIHEFEGLSMEADIRRNIGYGTVATRIAEPSLPYAGLVRIGAVATPVIFGAKLLNTWRDCVRCASDYGVRWFELPFALGAAVIVNIMEIPGMLAAYRRLPIERTAYR